MSRTIGRTSCKHCGHPKVKLDEQPREITEAEYSVYDQYAGLIVARAHCPICQTKYLAWVDESETQYFGYPVGGSDVHPSKPQDEYFDLSYQSTFDDEPDEGDIVNLVKVAKVEPTLPSNGGRS